MGFASRHFQALPDEAFDRSGVMAPDNDGASRQIEAHQLLGRTKSDCAKKLARGGGDANLYVSSILVMPRIARVAPGGIVYHVLNRASGRLRLFKKDDDFLAFEEEFVNQPQTPAEEKLVKTSIERSRPFGADASVNKTARRLQLQQSLRPRSRPKGWRKNPEPPGEPQ